MRANEIVETIIDIDTPRGNYLLHNPPNIEVRKLLRQSPENDLRGLLARDHLLIGDGYHVEHVEMEDYWDEEWSDDPKKIVFSLNSQGKWVITYRPDEFDDDEDEYGDMAAMLMSHPLILRATSRQIADVIIESGVNDGFWSATQKNWLP